MPRVAREIMEAVLLALVALLVLQGTVRNFKVEGSSMSPTLQGGQYLVVDQVSYFKLDVERLARIVPFWDASGTDPKFAFDPPTRGEIIVFRYPDDPAKDFVKRVVGLPGETVAVRSGTVYIDGEALREPYLQRSDRSSARELTLGAKEYYVIGDNRRNSNDSRSWGVVPEDNIVGRVFLVYWPWEDVHIVSSY
jgi:signal peptidase I